MLGSAATAQGDDVALIHLDNFQQWIVADYDLDSFSSTGKKIGGASDYTRNAFKEIYGVGINYFVYGPRLFEGSASVQIEGDQYLESNSGQRGNTTGTTFGYDVSGRFLKAKPYPFGFYLNSSTLQVNPAFSRSYDLKTDHLGTDFTLKNSMLPFRFGYSRYGSESNGNYQDRRDKLDLFTLSLDSATALTNSTSVSMNLSNSSSTLLSTGVKTDSQSVGASLTNQWKISSNVDLPREARTTLTYNKTVGDVPSEVAEWNEEINWALGKALKLRLNGDLNTTTQGPETKHEQKVDAFLEQRIAKSITTQLNARVQRTEEQGGSESLYTSSAGVAYQNKITDELTFLAGYAYGLGINDSSFVGHNFFLASERLNVYPLETNNYLMRNNINISTIVVWNANRTRKYQGPPNPPDPKITVDYTPVSDGVRTRIRIEQNSSIAIGDVLLVEYDVNVNAKLESTTRSQNAYATLDYRQNYKIGISWNDSTEGVISGTADTVPLTETQGASLLLEKYFPEMTLGTTYTWLDSVSLGYHKAECYWKYRHEFESNRLEANVRDVFGVYKDVGSGAGLVRGGNSNQFTADTSFNKNINEKTSFTVTGRYENSSGRLGNEQLYTTWFQGRYRVANMETGLIFHFNWRMYPEYSEHDYSVRLETKRFF